MLTHFIETVKNPLKYVFTFIVYYFLAVNCNAQTKTNLQVFYSLTDSVTNRITENLENDNREFLLVLNLGTNYSLFANHIKTTFEKSGIKISHPDSTNSQFPQINIVIEGAGVEYGEMFRDGWFGKHYIPRYCAIYGNYLISESANRKVEFEYSVLDTVKVDDITKLESSSYPFTQGSIPSEPFLSGFAEPLIAIGTAAAVVILFFSVRSK